MTNFTAHGGVAYSQALSARSDCRLAVNEGPPAGAPKPKLLDQVRHALRARHDSRRTEEGYVMWTKRFIFFHGVRSPADRL